jgi:hypothetical protein
MKTLITALLCLALVGTAFTARAPDLTPPQKDSALVCLIVVVVIGTVTYVIVRGLLKMCRNCLRAPTNALPVLTNSPAALDLVMPGAVTNTGMAFECNDGHGWVAQYRFVVNDMGSTVSVTALDAQNNVVQSNNYAPGQLDGQRAVYCDFSALPAPASPARLYRLVSTPWPLLPHPQSFGIPGYTAPTTPAEASAIPRGHTASAIGRRQMTALRTR